MASTSSLKYLQKHWKMVFSNAHDISFWAQGFSKTIFWESSYAQIVI